ncbi:MAG: hypothetical protein V1744_05425 [Candidatus Altiarchaeota archaeon]
MERERNVGKTGADELPILESALKGYKSLTLDTSKIANVRGLFSAIEEDIFLHRVLTEGPSYHYIDLNEVKTGAPRDEQLKEVKGIRFCARKNPTYYTPGDMIITIHPSKDGKNKVEVAGEYVGPKVQARNYMNYRDFEMEAVGDNNIKFYFRGPDGGLRDPFGVLAERFSAEEIRDSYIRALEMRSKEIEKDIRIMKSNPSGERYRLSITGSKTPETMEQISGFLKSQKFDPEECYYEFKVSGGVTPANIKALLELPYEANLTERGGQLVLITGCERNAGLIRGDIYKMNTRFHLHTHPNREGGATVTTPSIADDISASDPTQDVKNVLAHKNGLTVYGSPTRVDRDIRDFIIQYGRERGVDALRWGYEECTDLYEMPPAESVRFQRGLAEEAGIIRMEARWEDEREIAEIMRYINL